MENKRTEVSKPQARTLAEFTTRAQNNYINQYIMLLKILRIPVDLNNDQNFLTLMEDAARCAGLVEYLKLAPYDLTKYRLRLPLDICEKHGISVANIWERINGKPREEFYDAVLELAN